jgi:hypothetical protein
MDSMGYPELELVGGALAEWPSGQGPRGETIAPAVFVDADGHDDLLALPHQFHAAGMAAWGCEATWQRDPLALDVRIQAPVPAGFRVRLDPNKPGRVALIEAILRDGTLYICPTSPKLGLNARLARDHSFFCAVDQTFAGEWRQMRARR